MIAVIDHKLMKMTKGKFDQYTELCRNVGYPSHDYPRFVATNFMLTGWASLNNIYRKQYDVHRDYDVYVMPRHMIMVGNGYNTQRHDTNEIAMTESSRLTNMFVQRCAEKFLKCRLIMCDAEKDDDENERARIMCAQMHIVEVLKYLHDARYSNRHYMIEVLVTGPRGLNEMVWIDYDGDTKEFLSNFHSNQFVTKSYPLVPVDRAEECDAWLRSMFSGQDLHKSHSIGTEAYSFPSATYWIYRLELNTQWKENHFLSARASLLQQLISIEADFERIIVDV